MTSGAATAGDGLHADLGIPAATLDVRGVIVGCNHGFARSIGFRSSGDAVGQRLSKWVVRSDFLRFEEALRTMTRVTVGVTLAREAASGLLVLPSADGVTVLLGGHRAPAAEAPPEFTEFVAGIAHEINNPLGFALPSLLAASALVSREGSRSEELTELLEQARIGLERITQVVSDLRSFRAAEVRASSMDVNEVVVETLRLVRDSVAHVRVSWDLGGVPMTQGEPGYLGQVLLNLVNNSVAAMPLSRPASANRILVRTWTEDGRSRIQVRDNGPGIPADIVDQIFDPFVSRRAGGTGLGLTVCANLVRAMGGEIWAHSSGAGAVFEIALLQATCDRAVERVAEPVHLEGQLHVRRVVLIDDERLIRRVIRRAIAAEDTVEFGSGNEALVWLRAGHDADVIICDRVMANGTGEEVYDWLVQHRPHLAERFVFITGARKGSAHGISGGPMELKKPFAVDDLLRAVRELAQS